jgi:hypothetical protein
MKANEAGLIKHAAMVNFEREVQSIERSTSWRVTKPLRWLKSRLGRGGDRIPHGEPSLDGGAPLPWSADQK